MWPPMRPSACEHAAVGPAPPATAVTRITPTAGNLAPAPADATEQRRRRRKPYGHAPRDSLRPRTIAITSDRLNSGSCLSSNDAAQTVHRPIQVLLHTADAQAQCVGNFLGRPAFKVAQGKYLLLARRELAKGLPNTLDNFPGEGVFLWRRSP